jgi:hypothetical protein
MWQAGGLRGAPGIHSQCRVGPFLCLPQSSTWQGPAEAGQRFSNRQALPMTAARRSRIGGDTLFADPGTRSLRYLLLGRGRGRAGSAGKFARTAQRFGRPTSCQRARNHLDGCGKIDPPARMHDQRADPWLGAHPASDDRVADPKQTRGTATITRPLAFGQQWPVCDANRRHTEHRSKVQRQPSPAGVVTTAGVEQQHVRTRHQTPHRVLHQRTHPQRQQPRNVRPARHAGDDVTVDHVAFTHCQRSSPSRVIRAAPTGEAVREAHPAAADSQAAAVRSPRLGSSVCQLPLQGDERLGVDGPHDPILTRHDCGA